jgi:hypothetical protein
MWRMAKKFCKTGLEIDSTFSVVVFIVDDDVVVVVIVAAVEKYLEANVKLKMFSLRNI